MNKTILGTAAVALIVGIGAGYAGATMLHPAASVQSGRGNFSGTNGGNFGGARGGAAGGFLSGTVASKDTGSITLNTRDGSSHVVLLTPVTAVSKSVSGSQSDVTVGSNVIVTGTVNGDGSVSANLIQLRPTTLSTPQ